MRSSQVSGGGGDAPTSTLDSSTTGVSLGEVSQPPSMAGNVAAQPTTTTPTRGTGRERRSKTRKRHANFAIQETNTLLSEIRRSRHILFNVISPTITPNRKVAVWEEISSRLSARGWNRRAGKELRRKWENLRYETKIKFMKQMRGEQYHLKWTPLNTEVLQLMREDATYSLPSAIEDWKVSPQIKEPSPEPATPPSNPSHDDTIDDRLREDAEKLHQHHQAQHQQHSHHPHHSQHQNISTTSAHHHHHHHPTHGDDTTDNCEDIAAAAQAMETFMCDNSNKPEPSVEIKSEGQTDPCHLMTHLTALEPDMLHPALRSIEMSGSIDGDGPELTRPTLNHERIDSLEHQLNQQLPNFNSLNLPDPVGQNHHGNASPSLDTIHGPPISRFVQTGPEANSTEARLRIEVLRMKHEAYRAKRDYYTAKMRSLCDNRTLR